MKSLFEQMGGTYHEENGYLTPSDITSRKINRFMGAASLTVYQAAKQKNKELVLWVLFK